MTAHDHGLMPDAHAQVEDLLYEYCEAVDAGEPERAAALFTADCVVDRTGLPGVAGLPALEQHLLDEARRLCASSHHCSNVRIEVSADGASAHASSYLFVWRELASGSQERGFLRCADDLMLVEGAWRIRRRVLSEVARVDAPAGAGVFEVMSSSRAVRRFRDEPVPERLLRELVEAATWAPSPQNRQPWEFLVLTGPESLGVVQGAIGFRARELDDLAGRASHPGRKKMFGDVARLIDGIGSVPAVVLVCGHPLGYESPAGSEAALLSALHGASQNLLLAARALGLGAVFTTLHAHGETKIREGLGIPDDVSIAGTIVLGWPAVPFGRVNRRPVDEVLHWQRWQASEPSDG